MSGPFNYLYVEDDPLSREVMHTLLADVIGVQTLVLFEDSEDFIERLAALSPRPDFILLDIHITPHDGYDLLAMVRADERFDACKVIAVTASVMSEEVRLLKRGGFDGALSKPLDMITFPDLIARLEAGEKVWQVG